MLQQSIKEPAGSAQVTDCACVIHGTGYDWIYVERLYNMLQRNLHKIRFHVYTEHDRSVPPHMIKHVLQEWPGVKGPKKSWWYKMQLFNPEHHSGNLLYLDLDTVILNNVEWITQASTDYFWTIRDFRYVQRPTYNSMNSSLMWWNVPRFGWVWKQFCEQDPAQVIQRYQGDQDYLQVTIAHPQRRFFDDSRFQSWRWQTADGGLDFRTRRPKKPGSGAKIGDNVSILVFHGQPKPHAVQDPVVVANWQ